ncbi:hypothetical protein EHS25_006456 [Saitozyma podzolica]|uniref:Selenoprotein W n=1 Tax=Saitozyma podzolica TaxID=1890683 RepID=A0A427YRQ1_9TREE|nr:hypothetical protein EHS25_006456 [Saitozyma podzolica]
MSQNEACADCDPAPASTLSSSSAQPASKAVMVDAAGGSTSTFGTLSSPEKAPVADLAEAAEPSHAASSAEIRPPAPSYPHITIEFCDRCRWAPRATWTQTELFLTFPTPVLKGITLLPLTSPETGGRFRVWVDMGQGGELVWDRKTEGGFPELKILKQRIRNIIQPELNLGHSDAGGKFKS